MTTYDTHGACAAAYERDSSANIAVMVAMVATEDPTKVVGYTAAAQALLAISHRLAEIVEVLQP